MKVAFATKVEFVPIVEASGFSIAGELPSAPRRPIGPGFFGDFPSFQGLAERDSVNALLTAEWNAVERCKPRAILSYLQPTTVLTAHRATLPLISIARWTEHPDFVLHEPDLSRPGRSASTSLFNNLLEAEGIAPVDDIWDLAFARSDTTLAPSVQDLEPGLSVVPNLHYVGYIADDSGQDFNVVRADPVVESWCQSNRRKVYCYTSAKELAVADYIEMLSIAANHLDIDVLISRVHDRSVEVGRYTDRVQVAPWVPGQLVTRTADAVMTVGTRTTLTLASLGGAGNVCFPSADFELRFVSRQWVGVGAAAQLSSLTPSAGELGEVIESAMDGAVRTGSRELGDLLRAAGGPEEAAAVIEARI